MTDTNPTPPPSRFRTYIYGVRRFLRNRYFWGGLAVLILIGLSIYMAVDRVIMPDVTRHGVSVTVPDVTDMPPGQADSVLAAAGLNMQQQLLRKLNLPRNRVIDQRPPGGRAVKPGRSIYVTINTGDTTTVAVPSLLQRSVNDVGGYLAEYGLKLGATIEDSIRSTAPRDVVTRQAPIPGIRVPIESPIRVWYSIGPSAEFVIVPDVAGRPVSEARTTLEAVGLRVVILGAVDGTVRDQGPAAGTTVREGSEVRLRTDSDD